MFENLEKTLTPPPLDTMDSSSFWVDDYISQKLLEIHLDSNLDLASRKPEFMDHSVQWIKQTIAPASHPCLLDIGCGPGLYAERFVRAGYTVTGIDFSRRSIEYARQHAFEQQLPIEYIHQNYLAMELNDSFDAAVMIYCDYGALTAENRKILLNNVYNKLRPGGRFLLDVCSVRQYESTEETHTWELCEGGFWSPRKHLCFNAILKYPTYTTLNHVVVMEPGKTHVYYIWNHSFTRESLVKEITEAGFNPLAVYGDIAGSDYQEDSLTIAVVMEKE